MIRALSFIESDASRMRQNFKFKRGIFYFFVKFKGKGKESQSLIHGSIYQVSKKKPPVTKRRSY